MEGRPGRVTWSRIISRSPAGFFAIPTFSRVVRKSSLGLPCGIAIRYQCRTKGPHPEQHSAAALILQPRAEGVPCQDIEPREQDR